MLCIILSVILVVCYCRLATNENLLLKLVYELLLLRERYCLSFFFFFPTQVCLPQCGSRFFDSCELILASLAKPRYLLLNVHLMPSNRFHWSQGQQPHSSRLSYSMVELERCSRVKYFPASLHDEYAVQNFFTLLNG